MRLALWGAFLVWLACSDSDQVVQRPTLPEQGRRRVQPRVSGVQTPTGTVHTIEVRAGGGRYRFLPASLTIKQGDTVRWVAYDSPPHNVAFFHDRIPANSAAALQGIMPGAREELAAPFMLDEGDSYEIQFTNVPPGQYSYRCQRHAVQDMSGTIVIEP